MSWEFGAASDKGGRDEWIRQGRLTARDRARAIARGILDKPLEPKIHPEIEKEIRSDFNIFL